MQFVSASNMNETKHNDYDQILHYTSPQNNLKQVHAFKNKSE